MSNTRRAELGSPLRQERWASSEEFERGLLGNAEFLITEGGENPLEDGRVKFIGVLKHLFAMAVEYGINIFSFRIYHVMEHAFG